MRRMLILVAAATGLVIASAPAQAQPDEPPEPTGPTVTIESGKLLNDWQVRVTGTVTCEVGDEFTVSVEVRQRPDLNGSGGSFTPISCTGEPQQWTATTFPSQRPWHPGPAFVYAFGSACDPEFVECTFAETFRDVHLSKST